jgi:hypothetical protein
MGYSFTSVCGQATYIPIHLEFDSKEIAGQALNMGPPVSAKVTSNINMTGALDAHHYVDGWWPSSN